MTIIDDIATGTGRKTQTWITACDFDRINPGMGVAVLTPAGDQIAIFRLPDDSLAAIGNLDPVGRAAVLSRGLVGSRGGVAVVQSPLKKEAYSLETGLCLDKDGYSVPVYPVRRNPDSGIVEVCTIALPTAAA